ncbi:hypothetical protein CRG98_037294 [Punica granatum]|uniref:Uncharacterized protein n=1 Tax=Punica granatum TaxID=22663 RepID=A0A2I0IEV0_PUNGR|nr:hypothetical protein CRG98_037294 [Punica granatum]
MWLTSQAQLLHGLSRYDVLAAARVYHETTDFISDGASGLEDVITQPVFVRSSRDCRCPGSPHLKHFAPLLLGPMLAGLIGRSGTTLLPPARTTPPGRKVALIFVFIFSHDVIFGLPILLRVSFTCCRHADALPRNRVVTSCTRLVSDTPLNSKTSSTIASQSRNSFGCKPPWNSGILVRMPVSHRCLSSSIGSLCRLRGTSAKKFSLSDPASVSSRSRSEFELGFLRF